MNTKVLKSLAITAFCLGTEIPDVQALTYYISSSQGNDTNSGTSVNAPWHKLNKIYKKGISLSKFKPGDSILLKAGDIFEGTLWYVGSNGTPDARITIDRYGAGSNPIIIGDNPSVVWLPVVGHTGVYSGAPIDTFSSGITRIWDTNGSVYHRTNATGEDTLDSYLNKLIPQTWAQNTALNQTNVYVRTIDDNPPWKLRLLQDTAVHLQDGVSDYVTIQNLDIRRTLHGITVDNIVGGKILSNSLQYCFSIGVYLHIAPQNCEVAYNTTTLGGWTQIYERFGSNTWIHHNNISHSTNSLLEITNVGVQIHGSSELSGIGMESGISNITEFNVISNVAQSVVDFYYESASEIRYNYSFHSQSAVIPNGCGLSIHHNIFNLDGGRGTGGAKAYNPAITTGPDTGDNHIFNNVFYGLDGAGAYGVFSDSTTLGYNTNNIVRNNIFVSRNPSLRFVFAQSTNVNMDFNVFYCTAGDPTRWRWNNLDYTTYAAYRAASGQELHGIYANPHFVSANPTSADDFRLKPTSPCIDAGQNLKLAGLLPPAQQYKDFLGTPIPQGRRPDIGAYEMLVDPLYSPRSLRIIDDQ